MTNFKKSFAKGGIATAAVGAMALAGATPAAADDRYHNRGKIDAGDIIAGAVILGGIAAIASASKKDRYRYRDRDGRYGYRDSYRHNGNPRRAVEKCVRAVERDARRNGYRFADVTQIRDVDDTRYGWRVKGRLEVAGGRGYHRDRYDRYNRYDRYDRNRGQYRRGDDGRFTCYVERGRVQDIRYKGLRRL